MWTLVQGLLKVPFVNNLLTRLVNRWTAHGVGMVILQLQVMGILPQGTAQLVDGLPAGELAPYLVIAIGIYFIGKMPSKADRLKKKIEIAKLKKELKEVENDL